MRQVIFSLLLAIQFGNVLAQEQQWSSWARMSCFAGFQSSAKNMGLENVYKDSYVWNMKVKNNYSRKVHFNMFWTVGNERKSIGRFSLSPGEESYHVSFYFKSNSTNWKIEVETVCFGESWISCDGGCYAECDNSVGVPNQMTVEQCNAKKQKTLGSDTLSSNKKKKNDLTEYNQNKAELERQIQQQNQEIANRNAETQRQQQLLKQQQEQQRQQELQQGVNELTTATVDLVKILSQPRKRAKNKTLPFEDGQILVNIAKVPNPLDYIQKVIEIFSDLGYTHDRSENDSYGGVTLSFTEFHPISTITDYLQVTLRPAKNANGEIHNIVEFSREKEGKLKKKLACIRDNIDWKYYQDFFISDTKKL